MKLLRRSGLQTKNRIKSYEKVYRLQAIQLSPCHAGLAEQRFLRFLFALRFSAMLFSPLPFDVRWGG